MSIPEKFKVKHYSSITSSCVITPTNKHTLIFYDHMANKKIKPLPFKKNENIKPLLFKNKNIKPLLFKNKIIKP